MLIAFGVYWNDLDWLEASLEHLEYWKPTHIFLCEGCFDPKFPARSTDGTREYLEEWAKNRDNVRIIDNLRAGDYRHNQVETCNLILQLAQPKVGDWIMRVDCDSFYLKAHIDKYKEYMKGDMDYPYFEIFNFWDSTTKYYSHWARNIARLPFKIAQNPRFTPVWILTTNGIPYQESQLACKKVPIKEFHYEGFRKKDRLRDKYAVGNSTDRESPVSWKGGIKLKKRDIYTGPHSEFAIPVLREKGFNV